MSAIDGPSSTPGVSYDLTAGEQKQDPRIEDPNEQFGDRYDQKVPKRRTPLVDPSGLQIEEDVQKQLPIPVDKPVDGGFTFPKPETHFQVAPGLKIPVQTPPPSDVEISPELKQLELKLPPELAPPKGPNAGRIIDDLPKKKGKDWIFGYRERTHRLLDLAQNKDPVPLANLRPTPEQLKQLASRHVKQLLDGFRDGARTPEDLKALQGRDLGRFLDQVIQQDPDGFYQQLRQTFGTDNQKMRSFLNANRPSIDAYKRDVQESLQILAGLQEGRITTLTAEQQQTLTKVLGRQVRADLTLPGGIKLGGGLSDGKTDAKGNRQSRTLVVDQTKRFQGLLKSKLTRIDRTWNRLLSRIPQ